MNAYIITYQVRTIRGIGNSIFKTHTVVVLASSAANAAEQIVASDSDYFDMLSNEQLEQGQIYLVS